MTRLVETLTGLVYVGPAIHDDSPRADIAAALTAARTHPVPAVSRYLVDYLTARLAAA